MVRLGLYFAGTKVFIFFPCLQNFSPFGLIEKKLRPLEILIVYKSINAQFLNEKIKITWWQSAHLEAGYSRFDELVTQSALIEMKFE